MDIQTLNNTNNASYVTRAYTNKSNEFEDNKETMSALAQDTRANEKQQDVEQDIIQGIEEASGKLEAQFKELKFSIHKDTKRIMVRIVDKDTQEVLREIPPEKILDIMAKVEKNAGLYIDEKL